MKKKMILFTMLLCPLLFFGQTWDYTVKPGTEEWKTLNSNKEKVDICQLPENILKQTTTKDLFEIVLNYPLLSDIYAFNDIYSGTKKLFNDFNGIQELFNRPDVLDILLQKNEEILSKKSLLKSNVSLVEKGNYIISLSTMEMLLSIPQLQQKLNLENKKKTIITLMKGYELKKSIPEYFKGIGFETNIISRAVIIAGIEKSSFEKKEIYEMDFINKLDEKSSEFIK